MIPPGKLKWRHVLKYLQLNRYLHVSFRLNHYDMGSGFDSPPDILVGVVRRRIRLHLFIPKVELMVVGEDFVSAIHAG